MQKVKSPFTCHSGINSPLRSRVSKYQANGSGPTRLCHHSSVDDTVSALLFLHSPGRAHTPLIVVPRSMHCDSHHNYKDVARGTFITNSCLLPVTLPRASSSLVHRRCFLSGLPPCPLFCACEDRNMRTLSFPSHKKKRRCLAYFFIRPEPLGSLFLCRPVSRSLFMEVDGASLQLRQSESHCLATLVNTRYVFSSVEMDMLRAQGFQKE